MKRSFNARRIVLPVLLALGASGACGQGYPDRPIRIIDGFPPGGAADYLARVLGPKLTASLGQPIVVENRSGAGGTIGAASVAKSPPDGYTLFMASLVAMTASESLYSKLPYDAVRDLAAVTRVASGMVTLVVHPSLPVRSVKELVALAKARPGELKFASGGVGSGNHLAGELFRLTTGIEVQHIAYKGGPAAATAVVTGECELAFMSTAAGLGQIKAGRVRAIAVTGATRDPALPQVPTVKESGYPAYEVPLDFGLFAPAGTPREVVARLHAEVGKALALADVQERFAVQGFVVAPSKPEELAAIVRADVTQWARVVKAAGIRAN
ncbi:MAG: tripartite tricarboxylate transporter substrate binding protein [Burkholderiales bacterium]|nr:tripartite tricarboxylate transporter substrate binding protein [Burkholderiales bacterium]